MEQAVNRALQDERLKAEAWAVGLRPPEIVQIARIALEAERVPINLTGALDARRRHLGILADQGSSIRAVLIYWLGVPLVAVAAGGGLIAAAFADLWPSVDPYALGLAGVAVMLVGAAIGARLGYLRRKHLRFMTTTLQESVNDIEGQIEEFRLETVRKGIRAAINARSDEQYRTVMLEVESSALANIEDPERLIATPARAQLDHLLSTMPGGSIGLSGPRGAGKSSLISATCPRGDDQPEGLLGVVVPAPVEFDARDFILHLFAELCRTILGRDEVERLRTPDPFFRAAGGRGALQLVRGAALILFLAGVAMLVVHFFEIDDAIVWGSLVILAGTLAFFLLTRWHRRELMGFEITGMWSGPWERERRFGERVLETARRRLQDIWFQQSFTSGWSGSISLPVGAQGGMEGSRELARQQMSMPDIVGELRRLVELIAKKSDHRYGSEVLQVRIGIDELDKIDALEDAARFMNEIKVLFGIPNCFFLVSISEDAMSQFERRGLPMRDVFDSSFDDVVRVSPLPAERSVKLLRERTLGMPIPFMLLCHVMGGGLPRDLIRMARELLRIQQGLRDGGLAADNLSVLCQGLVDAQVRGKLDATLTASHRRPPIPAVDGFQGWLERVRQRPTDAGPLLETCQDQDRGLMRMLDSPAEDQRGGDLAREFLAFCYFCATVQEFFTDHRAPGDYREASGDAERPLGDVLAEAHQAFAVHPRAAWDAITEIRRDLGFETLPYPEVDAAVASREAPTLRESAVAFFRAILNDSGVPARRLETR